LKIHFTTGFGIFIKPTVRDTITWEQIHFFGVFLPTSHPLVLSRSSINYPKFVAFSGYFRFLGRIGGVSPKKPRSGQFATKWLYSL